MSARKTSGKTANKARSAKSSDSSGECFVMMPFGGRLDEIGTPEDLFGVPRSETPPHMTLLSLVTTLGDQVASDTEVVKIAAGLIESGRVVLTGNFAGCKISLRDTP